MQSPLEHPHIYIFLLTALLNFRKCLKSLEFDKRSPKEYLLTKLMLFYQDVRRIAGNWKAFKNQL